MRPRDVVQAVFTVLLAVAIAVTVGDMWTTITQMWAGAAEINPLIILTFESFGAPGVALYFLLVFTIVLALAFASGYGVGSYILLTYAGIEAVVVINNLLV